MFRILYSIEALLAGLFLLPFVTSEWEFKILRSTLDKDKEKHAIDLIKEKIRKPDATYNTIATHLSTSFDKSHLSETNNHWWCVATDPGVVINGLGPIVNLIQLSVRFFASLHPHEMHITLMELKFGHDINLNQDLKSAHQNNPKTFVDTLWEFEITNSTLEKDKETHAINLIKEKIGKPDATYNTIATHLTTSFDKSHPSDPNNRWWCVATGPVLSIIGLGPIVNFIQLSVRDKSLHPHEVHITLIELKFGRDIDLNQAQNAFAEDEGNALVGIILKQLMEYGVWKSVSANKIPELDPKTFLIYVDSLVEINQNKSVVPKTLHSHSYDTLVANLSNKRVKVPAIEDDPYLDYFFRNMDDKRYERVDTRSLLAMMLLKQYLLAGKTTKEMTKKLSDKASEAEKLKEKLKEELKVKLKEERKEKLKETYSSRHVDLMEIIAGKPEKLFKAIEIAEAIRQNPGTNDFKLLTEAYEISEEVEILANNEALHKFMFETTEFVKSIVQHIREIVADKSNDQEVVKQKEIRASIVKYIIQSRSGQIGYERKPVPAEYAPSEYVHWKVGIPKPNNDSLQVALERSFDASKGYFAVVYTVNKTLISSESYASNFTLTSPCSKIDKKTHFNEKASCNAYFGNIHRAIDKMMKAVPCCAKGCTKLNKADLAKGILEWAVRAYDAFVVHLKTNPSEPRKDAVKNAKELIFKILDDIPGHERKKNEDGFFDRVIYREQ